MNLTVGHSHMHLIFTYYLNACVLYIIKLSTYFRWIPIGVDVHTWNVRYRNRCAIFLRPSLATACKIRRKRSVSNPSVHWHSSVPSGNAYRICRADLDDSFRFQHISAWSCRNVSTPACLCTSAIFSDFPFSVTAGSYDVLLVIFYCASSRFPHAHLIGRARVGRRMLRG